MESALTHQRLHHHSISKAQRDLPLLVSMMCDTGERGRGNYNAKPRLQWTRVFMYQSDQNDPNEWEEAKNDVDCFIFSRAMNHPTMNHSRALDWIRDAKHSPGEQRPHRHRSTIGEQMETCYHHGYVGRHIMKGVSHLLWTHSLRLPFGTTSGRNT